MKLRMLYRIKQRSRVASDAARVVAIFALLTAAAGCTSLGGSGGSSDVRKIVDLISFGDVDALIANTSVPMILDGELIYRTSDIEGFWTTVRENGLTFSDFETLSFSAVSADSYVLFAESYELKTYFAKYVPETSRIALLESGSDAVVLLLGEMKSGIREILGISLKINQIGSGT